MKGGSKPKGFTITEVMIVLAVTGALFVSAAATISGRQAETQFQQALQNVKSQIQQTISEVSTNFYPNLNNFKCISSGNGTIAISSASGVGQGTNSGCIFLGKVMQFAAAKPSGGATDPQTFITYTIAGAQQYNGQETTNLGQSDPTVIAPAPTLSVPDDSLTFTLSNGLTVGRMTYSLDGVTFLPIGAVAFVTSQASYNGSTIQSGSQQVSVVPIQTSVLNATPSTMAGAIDNNIISSATSATNPAGGVQVCFVSGATKEYGVVTIGSNGRSLSVDLKTEPFQGGRSCVY